MRRHSHLPGIQLRPTDMVCDPVSLFASASCFNCLTVQQLAAINAYLLCQISNQSDVSSLFIADVNTVRIGTGLDSLFSTGIGSRTIAANTVQNGTTYRIYASSKTDVVDTGDLNVYLYVAGIQVAGALLSFAGAGVKSFNVEYTVTFRGSGAAVPVVAACDINTQTTVTTFFLGNLIVPVNIDTTVPFDIDIRAQWDGPENNMITVSVGNLERVYP